jgi:hypothetical protein
MERRFRRQDDRRTVIHEREDEKGLTPIQRGVLEFTALVTKVGLCSTALAYGGIIIPELIGKVVRIFKRK